MLVMVSCGPKSSSIVKTISTQIDNTDFQCYYSVDEFISQSKLRHLAFDRLVFTSKFINNDEEMSKLCDYMRNNMSLTEIVMILPKNQQFLEDVFKKYFDSPMYTLMYIDKVTTLNIVDAIKLPVVDVKAKYYTFDKPNKEDKKSKFRQLQGGKRNKSVNQENNSKMGDVSSNSENSDETEKNNSPETVTPNIGESNVNIGNINNDSSFGDLGNGENSPNLNDSPVSVGIGFNNSENLVPTTDDLDLTLGDFGSQHSDSGFVGDDDYDELEEFAKRQNEQEVTPVVKENPVTKETPAVTENPVVSKTFVSKPVINDNNIYSHSNNSRRGKDNNIIVATGIKGSGCTAYVVNMAVSASKSGNKVLIVDLDYIDSGILSFIDVKAFYNKNCYNGLYKKRIYTEDYVDIISNGYNAQKPTDLNLNSIFSDSFLFKYDLVIVDCPIECLGVLPVDVLKNSETHICSISDVSKLIELSAILFNRDYVSSEVEKHITAFGKVVNKNISTDDIRYVKSVVMFPNGCWLDNK